MHTELYGVPVRNRRRAGNCSISRYTERQCDRYRTLGLTEASVAMDLPMAPYPIAHEPELDCTTSDCLQVPRLDFHATVSSQPRDNHAR